MDYGTNNNSIANTTTQTTRAFTGHEQIAELSGLIHMNARVYDSDIGRFLSADTTIQDPHDSQSYNRYSYVRNNPMVFTDPSGHSWFSKLWDKIGTYVIAVVVAVIAVYTGGLALMSMTGTSTIAAASGVAINAGAYGAIAVSGAIGGFAAGVASGLLTGASLGDSLAMGLKGAGYGAIGAVTAGYIGGISSGAIRASLHGITRAAISKAQGSTWSGGFWSGFATSLLSPLASSASSFESKVAMSAIVGGTAAELGGGKFANGAVTGAFIMMYNEMGHVTKKRISELNVKIQDSVTNFITEVEDKLGIKLRITQGYRSIATQNALYAKGRTAAGKIVTNAKGGSSYHNYGLAIDVVEIRNDGTINWSPDWNDIGAIGVNNGFEWGGNWTTILDRPHFQMTFGLSIHDLQQGKRP